MQKYEVELIGHFAQVIEVEATSAEDAEEVALMEFENDFYVGGNQGAEGWDDVSVEHVDEMQS